MILTSFKFQFEPHMYHTKFLAARFLISSSSVYEMWFRMYFQASTYFLGRIRGSAPILLPRRNVFFISPYFTAALPVSDAFDKNSPIRGWGGLSKMSKKMSIIELSQLGQDLFDFSDLTWGHLLTHSSTHRYLQTKSNYINKFKLY